MSWSFSFVAASNAAALERLNQLGAEAHNQPGADIARSIVEAMPEVEGFGLMVETSGHIAAAGHSSCRVNITHISVVGIPDPGG